MTVPEMYAAFVLTIVDLHKKLVELQKQVTEETKVMYQNMLYPFLCALNQLELLGHVQERFGGAYHELEVDAFKAATEYIFSEIGPAPDVSLQQ